MNLKIFGVILVMTFAAPASYAKEIPADHAVRAIIGEAENQGYAGMLAVACAIRNRNNLHGVFGLEQIHENNGTYVRITKHGPRRIRPSVAADAKKAWAESATKRIHNATHWENVRAFGMPTWARHMKQVYEVGDHVFFANANMSKMSKGV